MPPQLDRAKLVKVLGLTVSESDNEALAAIRMANKMLAAAGVGWGGLISGSRARVKTAGAPPPWMRPAPTMSIDEAFEYLSHKGEGDDWLAIKKQWDRRKYIPAADQRKMFDRVYDLRKAEDDARDIPE